LLRFFGTFVWLQTGLPRSKRYGVAGWGKSGQHRAAHHLTGGMLGNTSIQIVPQKITASFTG